MTRPIEVKGLKDLRRDLRKVDKEAVKEVRVVIRDAARIVASEAAALAPRGRSGKLAASYRGTTSGTKGIVRNRQVYSRFIEFGFHPGGGRTFVPGKEPIGRALENRRDDVIEALGDGIDKAARSSGWH